MYLDMIPHWLQAMERYREQSKIDAAQPHSDADDLLQVIILELAEALECKEQILPVMDAYDYVKKWYS